MAQVGARVYSFEVNYFNSVQIPPLFKYDFKMCDAPNDRY